jgi:hypothetical protein
MFFQGIAKVPDFLTATGEAESVYLFQVVLVVTGSCFKLDSNL